MPTIYYYLNSNEVRTTPSGTSISGTGRDDQITTTGTNGCLTIHGGNGNDDIAVSGQDMCYVVNGGAGGDNLGGAPTCRRSFVFINGGSGNDDLLATGESMKYELNGDAGDDSLCAGLGLHNSLVTMNGGAGNDYYQVSGAGVPNAGSGNTYVINAQNGEPVALIGQWSQHQNFNNLYTDTNGNSAWVNGTQNIQISPPQ